METLSTMLPFLHARDCPQLCRRQPGEAATQTLLDLAQRISAAQSGVLE